MIGLVIKDLYNIKSRLKNILIFFVFFVIWSLWAQSMDVLSVVVAFLPYFLIASSVSCDENTKYASFALTMPLSRRHLVFSKYILVLFFYLISGLVLAGIFLVQKASFQQIVQESVALSSSFLLLCIFIPLWLRWGVDKSRYIILIVFLLFYMVPQVLRLMEISFSIEPVIPMLLYFIPVALPIAFLLSILVSLHLYRKKEF